MINSFINFDGISTSQTLPVPLQQVTVEDGAQGAKPIVLTCHVCLFPGLERKVACVPTPRGLFCQPMGNVIYLVFPTFFWAIEVDLQNMKSHVAPKTLEML